MQKFREYRLFENLEKELHPKLVGPARAFIKTIGRFEGGLPSMGKAKNAVELEDANEGTAQYLIAHDLIERAATNAGHIDAAKTLPSEATLKGHYFAVHPDGNLMLVRRRPPEQGHSRE